MDSRKTGELIKEIRIEKNMKQKDLADRLFVSVAAVSKWENGHGFPDVSVLPDLCRILDLSIEEFMKGERNSMENKQNTVIDDVVEIAGHQQKQRKKVIRILSILLLLLILVSIMQGALSYMRGKKTYVPLKAGSDLMSTNMYIENNGDTPTLFYKGKKFKQLYDDFIIDPDKNEYLKKILVFSLSKLQRPISSMIRHDGLTRPFVRAPIRSFFLAAVSLCSSSVAFRK